MYKARTDAVFLLTWLNYGADKSILVVDTVNLPRDCRAIAQVRDPLLSETSLSETWIRGVRFRGWRGEGTGQRGGGGARLTTTVMEPEAVRVGAHGSGGVTTSAASGGGDNDRVRILGLLVGADRHQR
jgi:hypothetical protein